MTIKISGDIVDYSDSIILNTLDNIYEVSFMVTPNCTTILAINGNHKVEGKDYEIVDNLLTVWLPAVFIMFNAATDVTLQEVEQYNFELIEV